MVTQKPMVFDVEILAFDSSLIMYAFIILQLCFSFSERHHEACFIVFLYTSCLIPRTI